LGSAHGEIVIDYNGAGVQQAMGDLNSLSQQGTNLLRAGAGVTAFGGAIGGALLGATNQAADFQFQMDAVNAALGGLDAGPMEQVTQQALDLGAATKFSAGEVAGVQEQLAKSGLNSEQILGGATQAVLDLASATGEQLQPATVATAAALNLFGIDAAHTADVADIFTAGLNSSSATLSDFQRGINNLGPVMANLNRYAGDGEAAFRDTAAAVAYFNAQGLKAADAGVSLARGMTDLATPTSKATEEMNKLGISAFDMNGNMLPLPDLMDELQGAMSDMSDQDRIWALSQIFGAEAADVMNEAIKKGGNGLRQYQSDLEANGQAATQAAIRQDNLRGALENLSGSVQTAAIALGTPFLGPLQDAAKALTDLVNVFIGLPPEVQAGIAGFAALASALLLVTGGAITAAGAILRFGPAFAAAASAAAPFLVAMLAIGAAIGLGILAYKTDFMGFGRAVDATLARVTKAVDAFGKAFETVFNADRASGMNVLSSAIDAFGNALFAATGIDLVGPLSAAANAIQAFGNGWQNAIQNGFLPGAAALGALANAASSLGLDELASRLYDAQNAAQLFGKVFDTAATNARALGFNDIAAEIIGFGQALQQVTGLPVADFFKQVAGAVQVFGTSFQTARADGIDPLSASLIALRDALTQITGIDLAPRFDALGAALGSARDGAAEFIDTLRSGDIAGALQQLSSAAQQGIQSLLDTVTQGFQSIDLGQIAVNIAGWVAGKWDDLKTWIEGQTGTDLSDITLAQVAVNIASWVAGKIADLGEAIQSFLGFGGGTPQAGLGGTGVEEVDLGAVAVSVSSWVAGTLASADALAAQIAEWLRGQLQVSPEFVTMAGDLGAEIGQKVGTALANAIAQGIASVMSGGGGGGPGLASLDEALASGAGFGAGGGFSLGDAFANFDTQFTQAVEAALGPQFEQIKADLTAWIQEQTTALWAAISSALNSLTQGTPQAGLGGTGGSASLVQQLSNQIFEMFNTAATDIAKRVGTIDWSAIPQAVGKGIGDALANFGTQLFGANTAKAAGDTFDPTKAGTAFGDQLVKSFQSPEFVNAVSGAVDQMPAETFNAIGTGIMTKINEAIGTSLKTPTTDELTGAPTGVGDAMGAQLVQNIATGLQTAIDAAPVESFTAIGTSLITKIQGAIGTAMNALGTQGAQLAGSGDIATNGGGIGSSLVTSLATAIATAITAEPIESFAAVGTALVAKIQEAISAAMTTASTQGQQGPVGAGAVGGMGTGLVTSLATSIASSITEAPIESFAAIGTALQTKISEVLSTAMQAGGGKGTAQAGLGGTGGGAGIGQAIAQAVAASVASADFGAVGTQIVTLISAAIGPATGTLISALSAAISATIAAATAAAAAAQTVGIALMTAAGQGIGAGTATMTAAISAAVSATISAGSAAAAAAQTIGTALTTAAGQGIGAGTSTLTAAVEAMVAVAIDAGVQAAAGASAIGAAVSSGAASGVILTAMNDAVAQMVSNGIAAGMAAADASSPSQVAREQLGQPIGEGAALGVQDSAGQFTSSVENMMQQGIDTATSAMEGARKLFSQYGMTFGNDLSAAFAGSGSRSLGSDFADSLRKNAEARVANLRNLGDNIRENQGIATGGGQPTTIETTGTVEMDGEQMGTFTVETVLGGLIGSQRKGGKRRGRAV
jgi:TP901 family phage tail tape measure protein